MSEPNKLVNSAALGRFKENLDTILVELARANIKTYTSAEYEAIKDSIPVGSVFIITDD